MYILRQLIQVPILEAETMVLFVAKGDSQAPSKSISDPIHLLFSIYTTEEVPKK